MSTLPQSVYTSRLIAGQIVAELHEIETDARTGHWNADKEARVTDLVATFRTRCDIKHATQMDRTGKPRSIGYTDPHDPAAATAYETMSKAAADIFALKQGCKDA